jgi:solute carrier family 25 carnitine/acylcarnitine transporter 20/29
MRSFVGPGGKAADAPLTASILAGGLAGIGYWAFIYPIDYIKTLVQTDDLVKRKYSGMLDCYNQRKSEGIKSFFRGYTVCMMRSVPVNAGGFFVFEMVMRWLGRSQKSE